MKSLLAGCLVLSVLTVYPSLMAARTPFLGVAFISLGLCIIIILRTVKISRVVSQLVLVWFIVFLTSSVLNPGSNHSSLVIFSILALSFTVVSLSVLSNEEGLLWVNRAFVFLLSLQGLSALVTFFLLVNGVPREKLLIFDLLPDERVPVNAYFPMSLGGTNFFTLDAGNFMRFSGFFREPGVTQVAYIHFLAVSLLLFSGWKLFAGVSLSLGVLMSISTTSLATLPAMLLGLLLLKLRGWPAKLFTLLMIPAFVSAVYFAPYVGVKDKLTTHTHSIETRLEGFAYLGRTIDETYGMGEGMFSEGPVENSSINFVLSLRENGVFGVLLFSLIFLAPYFTLKPPAGAVFFSLTSPLLITVLFSQPIFYSVFSIFIFMNSYFLAKFYEKRYVL